MFPRATRGAIRVAICRNMTDPTMTLLTIPDEAVKFIAFQRTEVLRFRKTFVYSMLKRIMPSSLYNFGVRLESRFSAERIKRYYASDIDREFASIREFLPSDCTSILDIGCGVAGIDALLYRHFADSRPDVFLLDKTQVEDSVFYGFKRTGAFYNSLETARTMLVNNGVPTDRVHLVEATPDNAINVETPVDLVVSLISWGFHYPVDTYLHRVHELMNDHARLILDVRKDTGGHEALTRTFGQIEVIADEAKYERLLCVK
jgi:SAM-dependent methyltransferase